MFPQFNTYPSVLACLWSVKSDVLILVFFIQIHQLLAVTSRSQVVLMICWENWEISWEHLSPNRPAQLILVNLYNQHNRWRMEAIGQIYSLYLTCIYILGLISSVWYINGIFSKCHLEWRIRCKLVPRIRQASGQNYKRLDNGSLWKLIQSAATATVWSPRYYNISIYNVLGIASSRDSLNGII